MLDQAPDRTRGAASGEPSPLAGREFRAILLAEGQSVAGDQLARVAVSVVVYQRTSSAALTALTYALTYVPDAVAGPLLAGLADRYPRREVMAVCTMLQAVLVASMAVLAILHAPIWLIAACVVGEAFAQAPFKAAQNAVSRVILGPHYLDAGQARLTTLREAGQLVGLVGAAAVVGLLGVGVALLLDAATFLTASVLLRWCMRDRPAARPPGVSRHHHRLPPSRHRRALVTFSLLAALTMLPQGLIVPLADEMGAPLWSAGLLLAADPLGLVAAGLVLSRVGVDGQRRLRRITPLAVLCLGAMVPFALIPSPIWAAILLALSGWGAAYQFRAKSAYMTLLPDAVTGHTTGVVRSWLRALQGLTVLAGGAIAEWIGSASLTIALGGLLGLVGCAVAGVAWRGGATTGDAESSSGSIVAVSHDNHLQSGDSTGKGS